MVEPQIPAQSDDDTYNESTAWWKWDRLVVEATMRANRPLAIAKDIEKWLIDIGFEQTSDLHAKMPVGGSWCTDPRQREIGKWNALNLMEGMEGFTMAPLHRYLGWSQIEIQALLGQVRTEFLEQKIHGYVLTYVYPDICTYLSRDCRAGTDRVY